MDLRRAFDLVNRDVLWRILALGGIPPKLVNLISGLDSGTESAVSCDGIITDYFPVDTGVRQGCVLAPTLFNTSMDHVLGRMSEKSGGGVSIGTVRIIYLEFADDAVYLRRQQKFSLGHPIRRTNLDDGLWRCRYLCKRTKVRVFRSLVLPVLLYSCETWTLTGELRRRLNSFGTMSLRRIFGHRWQN